MADKVLITGASGSLANRVKRILITKGYEVITLSTNKPKVDNKSVYYWNVSEKLIDKNALIDCQHIIHLSGFNIMNQWTPKNKSIMYESRIDAAKLLYDSCQSLGVKPKTFISASALGFYGIDAKGVKSEDDSPSEDWLSKMCIDWESAAQQFEALGSRVIQMRISLLLSKDAGFLRPTVLSMRLGMGVVFGNGKQSIEWIHIEDAAKFVYYAIENKSVRGAYNMASEQKWTQYDFMKFIKSKVAKYAILIKLPSFVLRLIFGGRSVILVGGCSLSVDKLLSSGFKYDYPTLESAINNELNK
jgi:uncharacterized protein (TIGR01777 family)